MLVLPAPWSSLLTDVTAAKTARCLVRQPQCVISVGVSDHGVGHRVINFRCDVPERQRDGRAAVDS
jgi:hypothetical protein